MTETENQIQSPAAAADIFPLMARRRLSPS